MARGSATARANALCSNFFHGVAGTRCAPSYGLEASADARVEEVEEVASDLEKRRPTRALSWGARSIFAKNIQK